MMKTLPPLCDLIIGLLFIMAVIVLGSISF